MPRCKHKNVLCVFLKVAGHSGLLIRRPMVGLLFKCLFSFVWKRVQATALGRIMSYVTI